MADTQPESAGDWARARDLFLDLVELDAPAREQALERLGAEQPGLRAWVERLLAQDAGEPERPVTRRFGPYEAVRPIATGGMGEVLLARRVDGEFDREVAIKLLRARAYGEELVARFLRERQTLAELDHEYVARLLDGGTTPEGEPYLVMEYVEGEPLDRFVRNRRLDLRARLELFQRVLRAVEHAHGRGVIHRDLKPSNILVRSDGTPRLLDFGIARSAPRAGDSPDPLTRTGHRLYTPQYAAPEQVRGGTVSEATDVFALGVILYELLTGQRLWAACDDLLQLERAIVEDDPPPPSRSVTGTARRTLSGDLDTIVLTCLAKEPSRRYAGALDLRAELDLYLRGLPIRARRAGPLRRAWARARRRPWKPALALALILAAAAWGVALQRGRESERRRNELVAAIAAQVESARNLRQQGRLDAASDELDAALGALDAAPGEGFLRAKIIAAQAVLANHERGFDAALELVEVALELLPADDARSPELRASLLNTRAYALGRRGSPDARAAALAALQHARSALEPGNELTVDALLEVVAHQRSVGDTPSALATLAEAADAVRVRGDPRDENLAMVLNLWGLTLADAGEYGASVEKLLEAHAILAHHFGEGHRMIAQLRVNLGESLARAERRERAEEEYLRGLETWRNLDEVERVVDALGRLGENALEREDAEGAASYLAEAYELGVQLRGPNLANERERAFLLGKAYAALGRREEARRSYERALAGNPAGTLPTERVDAIRAALDALAETADD